MAGYLEVLAWPFSQPPEKKVPLTHRTPPHLGFSIVFSQSSHSKLDGIFHLETTKVSIMADKAPAEGSAPNLHKDEVTGELVSKSELKKRQKKREAEAKRVCL